MYGDNSREYLKHDIGPLTIVPLMTWNRLWLKVCWTCRWEEEFLITQRGRWNFLCCVLFTNKVHWASLRSLKEAEKISKRILQLWMAHSYWSTTQVVWLDFVKGRLIRFKQNHRALTMHTKLQASSPFNTHYCASYYVPGFFFMINSEVDHIYYILSRNPSIKLKLKLWPFWTIPHLQIL